ncbi:eCIS core domain-containing protein [Nostoc sp.]|uniref:eCIS core domain-containing protein n=1 Tax=Nostoc sp. TaxID=1180 RepID=UPI002FF8583B
MREYVSRKKQTTTGFSIPSLKHPTRGFGLESSAISRQAVPKIQPLNQLVTHDISHIPLRSQAKLSISQPGDIYEQEADSVAQQVMQRMAQPVNRQSIQREALPEDDEELQMKSLDNSTLQREALPEDEEELQMKSLDSSTLQREALPEDEEELQMKLMVQRQAEAGMPAAPDIEASINQARGGGQTMGDNIREPMEQAFGADFSGVKVHTDDRSDQLNRSIQARAFTTGQDVFFRQGEYNPGSRGGQELLAHELTHVVQQNGGAVQRSPLPPQQQQQDSANDTFLQKQSQEVVQRAVPERGATFKPLPNTGSYQARGGQNVRFNSAQHTRARFGFGTNTRYEVFSRFNPTMQGNRIVSIRGSNGEQVNVEGIQLDHQISWDIISAEMDRKNSDGSGEFYSFWDAKMYYNDIDNLVPALGALNAAAGAEGVVEERRQNHTIEAALAGVQHSWMNLQSIMNALNSGAGFTQISDEEMVNILLNINSELGGLGERLMSNS